MQRTLTAAALSALAATSGSAAAKAGDDLAPHLWHDRVLVALASSASDPALVLQRRIYDSMGREARDRDIVLIEALDGTKRGAALRQRFGGAGFRVVLVGKDGGAKLEADHPLGPDVLFPLIDSMPMRQNEMRRTP